MAKKTETLDARVEAAAPANASRTTRVTCQSVTQTPGKQTIVFSSVIGGNDANMRTASTMKQCDITMECNNADPCYGQFEPGKTYSLAFFEVV